MIEKLNSRKRTGVCHPAHSCQQTPDKFADTPSFYNVCKATRFQSNSNPQYTVIKYERRQVEGSRLN